jgi:hypothetical protein
MFFCDNGFLAQKSTGLDSRSIVGNAFGDVGHLYLLLIHVNPTSKVVVHALQQSPV